jgi:hypothetical protein
MKNDTLKKAQIYLYEDGESYRQMQAYVRQYKKHSSKTTVSFSESVDAARRVLEG